MSRRLHVALLATSIGAACSSGAPGARGQTGAGLGGQGPTEPVIASMQVAPARPGSVIGKLAVTADHPGLGAPLDTLRWEVDWGDGSPLQALPAGRGARDVLHRYADRGACGASGWCSVSVSVCNQLDACSSRAAQLPLGPPVVTGDEGYCDLTCNGRFGWQRQSLAWIAPSCEACDDRADLMCEGRGARRHLCTPASGDITPRAVSDAVPPELTVLSPTEGAVYAQGPVDLVFVLDLTAPRIDLRVDAALALLDRFGGALRAGVVGNARFLRVEAALGADARGALEALRGSTPDGIPQPDVGIAVAEDLLAGPGARPDAFPIVVLLSDAPPAVAADSSFAARIEVFGADAQAALLARAQLASQSVLAHADASDDRDLLGVRMRAPAIDFETFDTQFPFLSLVPIPIRASTLGAVFAFEALDGNGNRRAAEVTVTLAERDRGPRIRGVDPGVAAPGESVRIEGRYFDPTAAGNTVFFGSTPATPDEADKNALRVTLPPGAQDGEIVVEVAGARSLPFPFRVDGDGDGLLPEDEAQLGTDPADPDTDDDGHLDGADACPLSNPDPDGVIRVDDTGCAFCEDGVLSGGESDIDCGGTCEGCASGENCGADTDCLSQVCLDGRCAAQHCGNGTRDGDESGVDCGGSCARCSSGEGCAEAIDCDTGLCTSGLCELANSCAGLGPVPSGSYPIQPTGAPEALRVYCDMQTDGGGWTLVGSTRDTPLRDEAGPWHEDLARAQPEAASTSVWDGLRGQLGARSDFRVSCDAVDLSFYAVTWYQDVTAGPDSVTCFNEENGAGFEHPAPARRNNLSGELHARGEAYAAGFLEGEDRCDDIEDFAVDFDDRGIGGAPGDATNWGEADGVALCGLPNAAGTVWQLWVRDNPPSCDDDSSCAVIERCDDGLCIPRPQCENGVQDADEAGIDCGGARCEPCPVLPTCDDGEHNGDETDVDCGGPDCPPCPQLDHCSDGEHNEDETGVDCGGSCPGCPDGEACDRGRDCDSGYCASSTCGPGPSCFAILQRELASASGVYRLRAGDEVQEVYCDMTTHGGGWTLVLSTAGVPADDRAAPWQATLRTLNPDASMPGVWDGLRPVVDDELHDLRFSCRARPGQPFALDIALDAVRLYSTVTSGEDADSCIELLGGRGVDCADTGLFALGEAGQDWGEVEGVGRCGSAVAPDGQWLLWLREASGDCSDGRHNGDEDGPDCGGRCGGVCEPQIPCTVAEDCASAVCDSTGFCAPPRCDDGVRNGSESDTDCGGESCAPCTLGQGCGGDPDCESGACFNDLCVADPCFDGVQNFGESDVDCGGTRCAPCRGGGACEVDSDCDGRVCGDDALCRIARSCLDLLPPGDASFTLPSGVYGLRMGDGSARDVYCDMETEGGGWTLVAASRGEPLDDIGSDWYPDLLAPTPAGAHLGIWDGLRHRLAERSDLRFSCWADAALVDPTVDLAFFGVPWYGQLTASREDAGTCFSEANGFGYDRPAPRRVNLLRPVGHPDRERPRGRDWGFGFLEGEDVCGDAHDFAVDFDDRGMDSRETDGTDWGEDDLSPKCGGSRPADGVWLIWAREGAPSCFNGVLDAGESDVDCGGSCPGCDEGEICIENSDCRLGLCQAGSCFEGECFNGRFDPGSGETDLDCGGPCLPCADALGCEFNADCASGVCGGDSCLPPSCDDGVRNGLERGADCGFFACDRPCPAGTDCGEGRDCESGACTIRAGGGAQCADARCDDGLRNGDEGDVDCGGSCAPALCAQSQGCAADADCQSGHCRAERCVPNHCVDGQWTPASAESDVDCGGPCAPCAEQRFCQGGLDCASGRCAKGRCALPRSCRELDAAAPAGRYIIAPQDDRRFEVYCDTRTAGGGWTLVSASAGEAPDDAASEWHPGLTSPEPRDAAPGVWDGLRPRVGPEGADLRFACRADRHDDKLAVDLAVYSVDWYTRITQGSDAQSCFNVLPDAAAQTPPARAELLTGQVRGLGDPWAAGVLAGEDSCDDTGDFTVDFDDSGMDGVEGDGSDWGEDDGLGKCGFDYPRDGAWLIWLRERAPVCDDGAQGPQEEGVDCGGPCAACVEARCDDGALNGDETGLDCGGSCAPCPVDARCRAPGDCESDACHGGLCRAPACDDGRRNGDESDIDCGGSCAPCPDGDDCAGSSDCASGSCGDSTCRAVHCASGVLDGDESDVDCGGASCLRCPGEARCSADADCGSGLCEGGACASADSCAELRSRAPDLPSGVYPLRADAGELPVYCDMETDGGGWTLVASSRGEALDDRAGPHHGGLSSLRPERPETGVWDGLRTHAGGRADLRFACKRDATQGAMDVDLSFYAVPWYAEVTAGSDAQSCFSPGDGAGYERPAPARRDNLSGEERARGDDWDAGFLEGEDRCDDPGDFAVDFDDRGLDGRQGDVTDWGEDDGFSRCGDASATDGAWFIFLREPLDCRGRCGDGCAPCVEGEGCNDDADCGEELRCVAQVCALARCSAGDECPSGVCDASGLCAEPSCADGLRNGDETSVDCGGSCHACPEGASCAVDPDCRSGVCDGLCAAPTCDDGVRNGDESDVDCGGSCEPCGVALRCDAGSDCGSAVCQQSRCRPPSCADGQRSSGEADFDCGGPCGGCAIDLDCGDGGDCGSGYCRAGRCAVPRSCLDVHRSDPSARSGPRGIAPTGDASFEVWCEMSAGGGWSLVSSSLRPVDDAGQGYTPNLATLSPADAEPGVWDGLRPRFDSFGGDLRFACRRGEGDFDVDLSFFGVPWYRALTAGDDAASCFNVPGAAGSVPPARRNNLSGVTLPRGDAWESGALIGENSCQDARDFAIDFDDAGIDGDEEDGTDWGEDDGLFKCGRYTEQGAWFIFAREQLGDCLACGADCEPCASGEACTVADDCRSGVCEAGSCAAARCDDGIRNGQESAPDCGGECDSCDEGLRCRTSTDCRSGVCQAGACLAARCDDGIRNGGESDTDCGGGCGPCSRSARCDGDGDCGPGLACFGARCDLLSCHDGVRDAGEVDVDCGGSCGLCPGGSRCDDDADCRNGICGIEGACERPESCRALQTLNPSLPSGPYTLLEGATSRELYCDMHTDGGGWTLVAASRGEALDDRAADYYAGLASLEPGGAGPGVWAGLRHRVAGAPHDLRFSCAVSAGQSSAVDLSFYDVDWYTEITRGEDADSCFNEADGAGFAHPPPARRDNIGGVALPAGDPWAAGFLEGEDSCGDDEDFAVDFDDRGVDGDFSDGTDWGEADGRPACGAQSPSDGVWLIWLRE